MITYDFNYFLIGVARGTETAPKVFFLSPGQIIPYAVAVVLFVIACILTVIVLKQKKHTDRRNALAQKLSSALAIPQAMRILNGHFREMDSGVKGIGIYKKDNEMYRLMSTEGYQQNSGEAGDAIEPTFTFHGSQESRQGNNIYTYLSDSTSSALRIVTARGTKIKPIRSDITYISTILEHLVEVDRVREELIKTEMLERSKTIFSSPLFDRVSFLKLIGNIVLKAHDLTMVKIHSTGKEFTLGNGKGDVTFSKRLHIRDTDIKIDIFKKTDITTANITDISRFLNIISATLGLYSNKALIEAYLNFLETAVIVFEKDDRYYAGHSEKVKTMALLIGEGIGLEPERLEVLGHAALLHDVGMIGDIFDITSKEETLTENEYGRVKYHPMIGSIVTAPVDSICPVSPIILQHHELMDGTGYPNGSSIDTIFIEAKILSFCEILIGMVSDRPYRKGISVGAAIKNIYSLTPQKVDQRIYASFLLQRHDIIAKLNLT